MGQVCRSTHLESIGGEGTEVLDRLVLLVGLLAGLAAEDVVETGAELGEEAAGEGAEEDEPEHGQEDVGEGVEGLGAVVGGGQRGVHHRVPHVARLLGAED